MPASSTVCGLSAALSVIVMDPLRLPAAVGVKVTLIVHDAPAPTLLPQVLVEAKSPVAVTPEIASAAPPVFFKVIISGELVDPRSWLPKVRFAGFKLTMGAALPVPVSETACGLLAALSVMVKVPRAPPPAVGVKVTLTVHSPPAATADAQVLVSANGPETATLLTVNEAVPLLVIVTTCAALVVLTAWLVKVRVVGERLTAGSARPVPVSSTTCGLPDALSVIVRAPILSPATTGLKTTVITQLVVG